MKKEDVASLLVYALMLIMALLIGLLVIRNLFAEATIAVNPYVFTILMVIAGLILNVVLIELGHIIGGKIGKYNIVSVNFLGFCFYKALGKWKFGFRNFDGLTGETILAPKSEKSNPKPYIWFPVLFYVIELAVCIVFYSIGKTADVEHAFLRSMSLSSIIILVIGSMITLYNFVPVHLDSTTDGYRLTLVLSNPVNIEAYNELLRIQNLQREGKEVSEIKLFDVITDFTASLNLMSVYECLSSRDYDAANKIIEPMIADSKKISNTTYQRLIAQYLYIKIMTLPIEEARAYYDENVDDKTRRFISNDLSMESLRAYILIAGLLDESQGEILYVQSKIKKAMKLALPARAQIEKDLYTDALAKVYTVHPEWKDTEVIG
ncbi:MAG: hypothetical protein MJ248_05365 [Bacilli bacterium]|nr:hypothetical protein [Bacilli bacterium]